MEVQVEVSTLENYGQSYNSDQQLARGPKVLGALGHLGQALEMELTG